MYVCMYVWKKRFLGYMTVRPSQLNCIVASFHISITKELNFCNIFMSYVVLYFITCIFLFLNVFMFHLREIVHCGITNMVNHSTHQWFLVCGEIQGYAITFSKYKINLNTWELVIQYEFKFVGSTFYNLIHNHNTYLEGRWSHITILLFKTL